VGFVGVFAGWFLPFRAGVVSVCTTRVGKGLKGCYGFNVPVG